MLRLMTVFFIWMASTAYALEEADADYDAELHAAYVLAWNEADDQRRSLLSKAQRGWNEYRAANCGLLGDECYALMAQERAAELRYIHGTLLEADACRGWTEKHVRTILPAHGRTDRFTD
jgi:hypothetical protein